MAVSDQVSDGGGRSLPVPDGPALPSPGSPARTGDAPVLPPRRGPDPRQDDVAAGALVGVPIPRATDDQPVVLGRSRILEVPEPVALRPSRWPKVVYLVAVLLAAPLQAADRFAQFSDDQQVRSAGRAVGIVGLALILGAVLAWTWVNVDNARRLLAHSRRRSSISPWRGVFWWLAVPAIGLPVLFGLLWVSDELIAPASGSDGDAEVVRAFLVLGWSVLALVLWVRPYLYLGHVMRRINGDPSRFHRWIWAPLLTIVVSAFAAVALAAVGTFHDDMTRAAIGVAVLAFSLLPYVVWCLTGWTAMNEMDVIAHSGSANQRMRREQYLESAVDVD